MITVFAVIPTLKRWLLAAALGLVMATNAVCAQAPLVNLSVEEQVWVAGHREQIFSVGFDPYAGMDCFDFRGARVGFLPALLADMQKQLGLRLALARVSSWDDAYSHFLRGTVDILYGANPTPERERIMLFTGPALRYPYATFARKDSAIQTLGDLDGKRVGFIRNDFVSQRIPQEYPNIHFQPLEFINQKQGLSALLSGKIDGFITSGGGVEHEFLFNYPSLSMIAELPTITSDMTFAVRKDNAVLAGILNAYLQQRKDSIQIIARDAARIYNRKILRLTDAELNWLEKKGEAVVGVADDYLPFDFYQDGQYKGIAGETLKSIADITGIHFNVVHGPFADVYEKARTGSIDVLNIAKTEDRQRYFLYPRPISTERDIIVGLKTSPPVHDVYGLEKKRVAVIDGFWHEEYLRKNLKDPRIIKTADIMESLRLLRSGDVDYLIENPTVVEFYIHGLGYSDLVKRGNTSKDSFVYFGVNRSKPELASIMDKALTLINFEDMKYAGIQSVPTLRNEQSRQLAMVVAGLLVALMAILIITIKIVRSLANQKAQTQILKEREHLLYTDPLTGFHNRNYLAHITQTLIRGPFPQTVLVADLNNLKPVNDTHGHATGDALLVLFATLLRDAFPDGEIFRTGGDEFLVVLNSTQTDQIAQSVEAMKSRCLETPYRVGDHDIHPSAAVGYCIRNSEADLLDECIRCADYRMYEAKAGMKKQAAQLGPS
ncbi:MAG: transporter substrate-binding domain-containing protein [Formivibrio sp.]|nr:transporter substrate-binding domain-containing protein [Formivibrio sp.]